MPREAVCTIGVALHYLLNPFDVMPDHIAGIGYVDDALVLNRAAERLLREAPEEFSRAYSRASRRPRE